MVAEQKSIKQGFGRKLSDSRKINMDQAILDSNRVFLDTCGPAYYCAHAPLLIQKYNRTYCEHLIQEEVSE